MGDGFAALHCLDHQAVVGNFPSDRDGASIEIGRGRDLGPEHHANRAWLARGDAKAERIAIETKGLRGAAGKGGNASGQKRASGKALEQPPPIHGHVAIDGISTHRDRPLYFENPSQRDFSETIVTIAGMCKFIAADISNPKSSPLELEAIIPNFMIPFVPIIHEGEKPFAMFQDLQQKHHEWVLDLIEYDSVNGLLKAFEDAVVNPAIKRADKLAIKKLQSIRKRHITSYL